METRTVKSTSVRSATTDDLVLREKSTTRLIFRPMLVDNVNDATASVKGTFIYQRKGKTQPWEDTPASSLGTLKSGQGYCLELHSSEVLRLFEELRSLYKLHTEGGIPRGETKYVRANRTVESFSSMTDEEFHAVISGSESLGTAAVARLIRWASGAENFRLLFDRLEMLAPASLANLNAALGVGTLRKALLTWSKNRDNEEEEFWQLLLSQQSFVLEQIFCLPVLIIQCKAYVGGKSIANVGGHIADFLLKNTVTNAIGLIEIKTPKTPLLGREYRTGIYNISSELSGAVQQALTYRQSLVDERDVLLRNSPELECFAPRCVVLVGHAKNELASEQKRRSFELYRRQLADVEIITYDEMFARTKRLVEIMEGSLDT